MFDRSLYAPLLIVIKSYCFIYMTFTAEILNGKLHFLCSDIYPIAFFALKNYLRFSRTIFYALMDFQKTIWLDLEFHFGNRCFLFET